MKIKQEFFPGIPLDTRIIEHIDNQQYQLARDLLAGMPEKNDTREQLNTICSLEASLTMLSFPLKNLLCLLGDSYIKIKMFTKAIETYQRISPGECDKEIYTKLLECFEALNDVESQQSTLLVLDSLDLPWDERKYVLLKLAKSYELRSHSIAMGYYLQALAAYPNSEEVCESYCRYIVKGGVDNFAGILISKRNIWPNNPVISMLAVFLESHPTQLLHNLYALVERHPEYSEAHLALVRYNLFYGWKNQALNVRKQFVDKPDLVEKIDLLIKADTIIPWWGMNYNLDALKDIPSIAPSLLAGSEVVFNKFNQDSVNYLVYGTALLNAQYASESQSIEIVVKQDGLQSLIELGFNPSNINPCLYTALIDKKLMSCYVLPANTLLNSSYMNAFTILSLYADKHGHVFDPTGHATKDIASQTLRTVKPAQLCFVNDPTQLIHAVYYMTLGYQPTEDITNAITAINNYQLVTELNVYHLSEVIRQYLTLENKLEFVSYLDELGLLFRLFSIPSNYPQAMCYALECALADYSAYSLPNSEADVFAFYEDDEYSSGVNQDISLSTKAPVFVPQSAIKTESSSAKDRHGLFKSSIAPTSYTSREIEANSDILAETNAPTSSAPVITQQQTEAAGFYRTGTLLVNLKQYKNAVDAFQKAKNLDPMNQRYQNELERAMNAQSGQPKTVEEPVNVNRP